MVSRLTGPTGQQTRATGVIDPVANLPRKGEGSRLALFPERTTGIPALNLLVDGFPDSFYKVSARVSKIPLEHGATISDHAVPYPLELKVMGWVSQQDSAAFYAIKSIVERAAPFAVSTRWAYHEEMVATKFEPLERGLRGMRFTLDMQEIQRVGLAATTVNQGNTSGEAAQRTDLVTLGQIRTTALREAYQRTLMLATAIIKNVPPEDLRVGGLNVNVVSGTSLLVGLTWEPLPLIDAFEARWRILGHPDVPAPIRYEQEWTPLQHWSDGQLLRATISGLPIASVYRFQVRAAGIDESTASVTVRV